MSFDIVPDHMWDSYAPFYWHILTRLPPARAEAIVGAAMFAPGSKAAARASAMLGRTPTAVVTHAAPAPAPIDEVESVRRRAIEAGGGSERFYVLRTRDDRPADTVNVVGGAAPGVDAERWPMHDDEPMAHMFTLDVKSMPGLSTRPGVRCISLFCHSPDYNEAYEGGAGGVEIVFTTAKQLAAETSLPEDIELRPRRYFEPVAIDVDPAVWSDQESTLRRAIYGLGARVLGEPLWLQHQAGGRAGFLMQSDESFCDMNLGDAGIMYMYEDDAFWQCH